MITNGQAGRQASGASRDRVAVPETAVPETLHIDWTRCDGRGFCIELLPGLLARDDWGYPVAAGVEPGRRSDVPVAAPLHAAAADAVALCPRLALRLTTRR